MKINIKEYLDRSHLNRYQLAKKLNMTYPSINAIYQGKPTSIRFKLLEGLCRELKCTPNDILIPEDEAVITLYNTSKE